MEIHQDALPPGMRAMIVDDVLATGGTARAAYELARQAGADVLGLCVAVELVRFQSRARAWFEERQVPVYAALQL